MRTMGHDETSQIVEAARKTVDSKISKITKIPIGSEIYYIKRKRYVDNMIIAIEESYFIYDDDVESYDFTESITNFLFRL